MRYKKMTISLISAMIILCAISIISDFSGSMKKSVATSAGISLSNKKIGWGIRRVKNHAQPDLGAENKRLIDEFMGIAIGNPEQKVVYLTFDQGYEAGYTEKILEVLKKTEVPAAFFITGHYLNTQKDLVKRMIDEGHIVGNHTTNHYSMPDIDDDKVKEEITKLHLGVHDKFGYEMKYFRPPMGEYSQRTLSLTSKLGYTTVMWSFAYDDWDVNKQGRQEYGREKILSNIHPGAVILLHAVSKDNSEILEDVINEIKNAGYIFKSLDEFER